MDAVKLCLKREDSKHGGAVHYVGIHPMRRRELRNWRKLSYIRCSRDERD